MGKFLQMVSCQKLKNTGLVNNNNCWKLNVNNYDQSRWRSYSSTIWKDFRYSISLLLIETFVLWSTVGLCPAIKAYRYVCRHDAFDLVYPIICALGLAHYWLVALPCNEPSELYNQSYFVSKQILRPSLYVQRGFNFLSKRRPAERPIESNWLAVNIKGRKGAYHWLS